MQPPYLEKTCHRFKVGVNKLALKPFNTHFYHAQWCALSIKLYGPFNSTSDTRNTAHLTEEFNCIGFKNIDLLYLLDYTL